MRRLLTVLLFALISASVRAHAELRTSEPAAGAVAETAPEEVVLTFSEPLETLFSVFKVYERDAADVDLTAADAEQRLNGLAAALVNDVLELRDDEDEQVAAELVSDDATTAELSLQFPEALADGHYGVMRRGLSMDTHVTQDFFVFSVAAE